MTWAGAHVFRIFLLLRIPAAGQPPIVDMGAYEADITAPSVVSIVRADSSPTHAISVDFTVTISEGVTGVEVNDFSLTTTGDVTGASVTGVSGGPAEYTVTVATGMGSGTLRLDVPDTATITDMVDNLLSGLPYTGGEAYIIEKTPPSIVSILRADPSPTHAISVDFSVTFSEGVTGVDVNDFSLTTTGDVTGASVTGVSGGPAEYTVTVATGTGSGTLRLDVPDTATITDMVDNSLSGLPYTGGEVYSVNIHFTFLPAVVKSTP